MIQKSNSVLMAEKDGVEFRVNPNRTRNKAGYIFSVPCDQCGEKIETKIYNREKYYLCEYCKRKLEKKQKEIKQNLFDAVFTKGEQLVSKAAEEMKKQIKDFDESYEKCVKQAMRKAESFDSIPEAMVTIELLHMGYKVIVHQKVSSYTVDIALPDEKLIIEVDGKIYHPNGKDELRDEVIKYQLGHDWTILHIPAEQIRFRIKNMSLVMSKYKALS